MVNPSSYRSPYLEDLDLDQQQSSPFVAPYPDFNSSAVLDDALGAHQNQSSVPPTPYSASSFANHLGSFNNSPRGSDISYIPGNDFPQLSPNPNPYVQGASTTNADYANFGIAVVPPDFVVDEYDPSAYDVPADNSLLFGQDWHTTLSEQTQTQTHHHAQQTSNPNQSSSPSLSTSSLGSNHPGVSVSVIPALDNNNHTMGGYASGSPYDHGSPGSSNGGDDFHHQQQHAVRSRGSSISSQHNDYQGSATYGMESVHLDTSPNPNTGSTPSWAMKNPQSPPQIYIPGQTPDITHTATSPLPSPTPSNHSLNGGGGDNNNNGNNGSILPPGGIGMGIHIVPATPISAGVTQGGPFNMNMMNQGRTSASNAQTQPWGTQPSNSQHQQQQSYNAQSRGTSSLTRLPQAPPSQYTFPPNAALTPPPTGGIGGDTGNALSALGLSREGSPERGSGSGFLVPISQNPRTRSKSETSIRPQLWQMGMGTGYGDQGQGQQSQNQNQSQSQSQGQGQGQGSTIQLPNISYMTQQPPQFPRLNAPPHSASFGPPVSGSGGFDDSALDIKPNNHFLSPDYSFGAPTDLRRARSESHGHGGHRRNALSADMTPIYADQSTGSTGSAGNLYPPSNLFGQRSENFLSANRGGMNLSGGMMSSGGVHRRTASGGSGHGGHSRSLSRDRASLSASPYPSPHASPRTNNNEPLPDAPYAFPSVAAGFGGGGYEGGAPTVTVMGTDEHGNPTMQQQPPIQVARQNVTTHATADASSRRRRTDANFACPVPGCGSTFTRHFNLKGHLRSHNEERPFKCKWPGCDKGFARQHDCKRHEQLHLNIRPYTCQGCQRTFARMDALNRHLRSDAGTECQARQPILTNDTPNNPEAIAAMRGENANGMLTLKDEPDRGWQSSSPPAGGVMV